MRRLLINNPVGPLPNVRFRYLSPGAVAAYELSAASAGRAWRSCLVPDRLSCG